jgi:uroporphyrin-III C-methyltransferase
MGKVYIVGAGPGDPELLTLKARRIIGEADAILYDRLVSPEILSLTPHHAERIDCGKQNGRQSETQARIFDLLLHHARQPKVVVRLKGGDPMVFGRGAEEWEFLIRHNIETEIVPGVSSAIAVPALAGIPLTFRGVAKSFTVATGHCRDGENTRWEDYAAVDTLVVLMGVAHRASIARKLIAAGRPPDTPVAFIENGTTSQQRVVVADLGNVAAGTVEVATPAVMVVGEVVRLRNFLPEPETHFHRTPRVSKGPFSTEPRA